MKKLDLEQMYSYVAGKQIGKYSCSEVAAVAGGAATAFALAGPATGGVGFLAAGLSLYFGSVATLYCGLK